MLPKLLKFIAYISSWAPFSWVTCRVRYQKETLVRHVLNVLFLLASQEP